MMKIAMVSVRSPWFNGGQERVVAHILQGLSSGFEITLYCCGEKSEERSYHGIPVKVFKGYSRGFCYSPGLSRALGRADFDIVHAHGFTTHPSLAALSNAGDRPLVLNPYYHEVGSTVVYRMARRFYDPLLGKKLLRGAEHIISVSRAEKTSLREAFHIPEGEITVIPLGVDFKRICEAEPLDTKERIILYTGRLEMYKNIHHIIRAVAHLPDTHRLVIIGKGPYEERLRSLASGLGLGDRVDILTNASDDERNRWYKTCSVFVTLSETESFGLTVLEALSAGKPVIVNGGCPSLSEFAEKFEDSVFAVNLHTQGCKELAELIKQKADLSVRADLSDYSWGKVTERYQEVYENALRT